MGVLPVFCLEQAESVAKKKPNWTVGEFEIGKTRNSNEKLYCIAGRWHRSAVGVAVRSPRPVDEDGR